MDQQMANANEAPLFTDPKELVEFIQQVEKNADELFDYLTSTEAEEAFPEFTFRDPQAALGLMNAMKANVVGTAVAGYLTHAKATNDETKYTPSELRQRFDKMVDEALQARRAQQQGIMLPPSVGGGGRPGPRIVTQ